MISASLHKRLKLATEEILFSDYDYSLIKRGIDTLYELWAEETSILAGDLTNERMPETENGIIVTPAHAAHCVKDLMRTTKFLRGIHQAIKHYLEKKEGPISILYAGCGPYATLLTPLTSLYSPSQVRFVFLEINPISHDAVLKLYQNWGLMEYLEEIRLVDATDPKLQFAEKFDMILSETMQVGLRNEHQVPLTRNMIKFLKEDGAFIPERIALEAYLVDSYNSLVPIEEVPKLHLGTAYDFDTKHLPKKGSTIRIKMKSSNFCYLQLFTDIHIFGGEKLTAKESGLTLPLTLDRYEDRRPEAILFWYEESRRPDLRFHYEF